MKGVFITGTDTHVGKTYTACQIARELAARQIPVSVRKPVESGCTLINGSLHPEDAGQLLNASQSNESLALVCPYRFAPAISPQTAARLAATPLSLKEVVRACQTNTQHNAFSLIEGAGGIYSPICEQALNVDLAVELNLPIVLVSDDRLGGVNQTLLAVNAIEKHKLTLAAIVLNASTPNQQAEHIDNAAELNIFIDYPIFTVSYKQTLPRDFYDILFAFEKS